MSHFYNLKKMDGSINTISVSSEDDDSFFSPRVCVIGTGREGMSLATAFGEKFSTLWFNPGHTDNHEMIQAQDHTAAFSAGILQEASFDGLSLKADMESIRRCNFYVICPSTKSADGNDPDMDALWNACAFVGKVIAGGDIVVFDCRVCPLVLERECIPMVEKVSGLTCNHDFFAGCHPGAGIVAEMDFTYWNRGKITSGSTPEIARIVDEVYTRAFGADIRSMASISDSGIAGVG